MAKFCSKCGKQMDDSATTCPACGAAVTGSEGEQKQAQTKAPAQAPIIVNVENNNVNTNAGVAASGHKKDKWIAWLLCFFLGIFGAHKFYEGKIGMGILYLFTGGLFGIGAFVDFWILLFKPNPYYV